MKKNNKPTHNLKTSHKIEGVEPRLLKKLWFKLTGERYQFQIKLKYQYKRDSDGYWAKGKFISRIIQIGVIDTNAMDLGNRRHLHKILFPEFIKSIAKQYKRNGRCSIESIQYLGRFK